MKIHKWLNGVKGKMCVCVCVFLLCEKEWREQVKMKMTIKETGFQFFIVLLFLLSFVSNHGGQIQLDGNDGV